MRARRKMLIKREANF